MDRKRCGLLMILATYLAIGAGLATLTLRHPSFGQLIDRTGWRVGLDYRHARCLWLLGTAVTWPIGLFVLATGRLVLVDRMSDPIRRSSQPVGETYRSAIDGVDIPVDRLESHPHSGS